MNSSNEPTPESPPQSVNSGTPQDVPGPTMTQISDHKYLFDFTGAHPSIREHGCVVLMQAFMYTVNLNNVMTMNVQLQTENAKLSDDVTLFRNAYERKKLAARNVENAANQKIEAIKDFVRSGELLLRSNAHQFSVSPVCRNPPGI